MTMTRYHEPHQHLSPTFGTDWFGRSAERFARAFGSPTYLVLQTVVVIAWLVANAVDAATFDPYPFILLNLAFSTQAAYSAPMILLAETRQAERDRVFSQADSAHREQLSSMTLELLKLNTELTQQVVDLTRQIEGLTREIHGRVISA